MIEELVRWTGILAGGLWVTLQLVALAGVITVVLAVGIAIMSISQRALVRMVAQVYVDVFRSIPLLALLIFLYYVLGRYVAAIGLSAFALAAIGLALNEAAYVAEVYRAGLKSIPEQQWEAGASLGLGWGGVLRLIILPQALPPAIPVTLNMLIGLIKNSALASLIAVDEVSMKATILVSETFLPLEVFLLLAVMYLAIIIPLTMVTGRAEALVARRLGLAGPLRPEASRPAAAQREA